MKYKVGDQVEISKKLPASKYLHDELNEVNYIVTISEVIDFYKNIAERFYYVTDGTGKHDWFSVYEHHIIKLISR